MRVDKLSYHIYFNNVPYFSLFNKNESEATEGPFNISGILNKSKQVDTQSVISFNPIIIFQGLRWDLINVLFRVHGFNIYGGSSTRRHKLSSF